MSTNSVYLRGAKRGLSRGKRYFQSQTATAAAVPAITGGDAFSNYLQLATAAAAATLGVAHQSLTDYEEECSLSEYMNKIRHIEERVHHYTSFDFEPGTIEDIQQIISKCYASPTQCGVSIADAISTMVMRAGLDNHNENNKITIRANDHHRECQHESAIVGGDFPSLETHILNDNNKHNDEKFPINTDEAVPIENDFFVGSVKLALKPLKEEDDIDFDERIISKDSRFEIQIQGRLKRLPEGSLYMGAEVTEPVKMNPVLKAASSILLKLLSKVIGANMDYSFGDKSKCDGQLAHISFPLHTAMDRLVITKKKADGEEILLPCLGQPLEESEVSINARKAMEDGKTIWNTEDTYSMSFSSACVDVPRWRIVKPFDMDLSQFWGESLLRLVIYEKGNQKLSNNNTMKSSNDYLLAMQMRFLGIPDSHKDTNNSEQPSVQEGTTRPRRTSSTPIALS